MSEGQSGNELIRIGEKIINLSNVTDIEIGDQQVRFVLNVAHSVQGLRSVIIKGEDATLVKEWLETRALDIKKVLKRG